jgi:cytochrome oxidase Cu insertion factor (SCO1/SenC/PrrC family)/thiol-disulfide isomerase/thioredoxin
MVNAKRSRKLVVAVVAGAALIVVIVVGAAVTGGSSSPSPGSSLATNPDIDPGTPLSAAAPDFTLTDQFDRPVSLRSFRGKAVIIAFNDSECTTVCPLTTTAMLDAKAMLGAAGSQVQLLGIDANPTAIAVKDVRAYSEVHGMVSAWHFLTGSLPQLERVWRSYHIAVAIEHGQIDHTPALYVISPQGRLVRLYLTQLVYAAVPQLGQLLAQELSKLLPGHPRVQSRLSYAQIPSIGPTHRVAVPRAGGGSAQLGANGSPRLYLFFATWDQEVMNLDSQLGTLATYQATAAQNRLPALTAVDEGSLEPSPRALSQLLAGLPRPLPYPVAIDRTGRIADGYEVQDEPWLVLTSGSGRLLWYYDISTGGPISRAYLVKQIRAALVRSPNAPSTAIVAEELAGSPGPLAAVHQQADHLLGGEAALAARVRALRGYPVVVNVWGSWCGPCRAEFGLLGNASAYYGRSVAFLGADVGDSPGDAQAFMAQHPVSYPSYQMQASDLTALIPQGIAGTPSTIFFNRAGKIVHVQTGQYLNQGSLDGDVQTYALRG